MSVLLTRTTIGESGSICAACNTGRVTTDGRPSLDHDTVVTELRFRRPGAVSPGHSIHLCDRCLEDLRELIVFDREKREIREIAELMIDNLEDQAEYANVDLHKIDWAKNYYAWQVDMDDLFNDGGTARCERFFDIADDAAIDRGLTFETREFDEFRERCVDVAIDMLREKYPFTEEDEEDDDDDL